MKRFLLLLTIALPFTSQADDILVHPGKVISQPELRQPLGPEWSVAKGKWTPADGVLTAVEIPDEKHVSVLHLKTGPVNLVVDCEFRLNGGKIFYVGCDGTSHVGRLVITEKAAKLAEDSMEGPGKSHVLAETKIDLKQGEWQKLHVEYAGDQMAARLNGQEMKVQHEYLATPKVQWWFAAGGDNVQIRNIRFSEGVPVK